MTAIKRKKCKYTNILNKEWSFPKIVFHEGLCALIFQGKNRNCLKKMLTWMLLHFVYRLPNFSELEENGERNIWTENSIIDSRNSFITNHLYIYISLVFFICKPCKLFVNFQKVLFHCFFQNNQELLALKLFLLLFWFVNYSIFNSPNLNEHKVSFSFILPFLGNFSNIK